MSAVPLHKFVDFGARKSSWVSPNWSDQHRLRAGSGPTQGPSWGYLKVKFSETLSIFGDKCPRNGSNNGSTGPSTGLGYPHIGPFVEPLLSHLKMVK
jgi:hypothetical protein